MRLVNYCPSLKLLSDISAHPKWIACYSHRFSMLHLRSHQAPIPNNNPKFVTEQSPAVKLSVAVVECLPNGFEFMSYVRKIGSPSLTMP